MTLRAGRAGFAAVERFAFLQQLRACGTMDRAVDPAAAEQRRVRRIDDGVDRERGDVGDDDIQSRRSGLGREKWGLHPVNLASTRAAENRA